MNVINNKKEKKNMQILEDLHENMNFNSDRIALFYNYRRESIEKGQYFSFSNEDGHCPGKHT